MSLLVRFFKASMTICVVLLPALAVPHLAREGNRITVRPFRAAMDYRRLGLVWRASFPRSDDLVALAKFIQEHLPNSVRILHDAAGMKQGVRMAKGC